MRDDSQTGHGETRQTSEKKRPQQPQLRFPDMDGVWEEKRLGDIVSALDAGTSVNSSNRPANITEQGILKTSCVSAGLFDAKQNKVVLSDYEKTRLREAVQKDTIILSRMNTPLLVGANAIISKDYPNLYLPDRLWALKINTKSIATWLGFFLATSKTRYKLSSLATGTSGTMKNITKGDVRSILVPLPPLPEQQKIAAFLSAVDARIGQLEAKKQLWQDYKKGMMQRLFSQDLRFKDQNGHPFPDWQEKRLGDVAEIIMGQSPDSSSYNNQQNGLYLIQGNADISNRRSTPRIWTSEATKLCQVGDILMTVRAPVGAIALSNHNACLGRGVCALRAIKNNHTQFLYQLLLLQESKWGRLEQGSTFTAVNSKDIFSLKKLIPHPEEQQKIADCLTALDAKITAVDSQLSHMQTFKNGLLQQLFV